MKYVIKLGNRRIGPMYKFTKIYMDILGFTVGVKMKTDSRKDVVIEIAAEHFSCIMGYRCFFLTLLLHTLTS